MIFKLLDVVFELGINHAKVTEQIEEYSSGRAVAAHTAIIAEFSSLDSKSNSLLQHVSIMIASLSVSYLINPPEGVKYFVLTNILFYLLVILMTLRVITNVDFTGDPNLGFKLAKELKIRERYYVLAHSIASILTAILVISIIFVGIYYR